MRKERRRRFGRGRKVGRSKGVRPGGGGMGEAGCAAAG